MFRPRGIAMASQAACCSRMLAMNGTGEVIDFLGKVGNCRVRIPPFDAIELDLGELWSVLEDGNLDEDEAG